MTVEHIEPRNDSEEYWEIDDDWQQQWFLFEILL